MCGRMHGHNYRVEVTAEGFVKPSGMVIDFSDLRRGMAKVLDELDHQTLNMTLSFVPTAENLAAYIWRRVSGEVKPVRISSVRVWETGTSCATYRPDRDDSEVLV